MCHMAAMHYQWIYICKWWWSFKINVCENTLNNKHIFFECSSNNGLLTVLSRAHSRESIRGKNLSYEFTLQRSIHQFETFESGVVLLLVTAVVDWFVNSTGALYIYIHSLSWPTAVLQPAKIKFEQLSIQTFSGVTF